MNGKQAKKLKKLARELTVDRPKEETEVRYKQFKASYKSYKKNERTK